MRKAMGTGVVAVLAAIAIAACGGGGSTGTTFTAGGQKFTVNPGTSITSPSAVAFLDKALRAQGFALTGTQLACVVTKLKSAGFGTVGKFALADHSKVATAVAPCKSA